MPKKLANILEVPRGDTPSIHLIFADENDNPIDLTGSTIYFTVKRDWRDEDSEAIFQKIISSFEDPESGEFDIELTASDTETVGSFFYDIQVVYGSPLKVISTRRGQFIIYQDIAFNIS